MGFRMFPELPSLDENFLKILKSSEQVEIVGEDGEAVQLPLLLLCLHSDLVCSIVSTMHRHAQLSIYIPAPTEAVRDILENMTQQENKPTTRSLLVYEILGIKVDHEFEEMEHSSDKASENRIIKHEAYVRFM